ncbi:MAG: short-subunit dehydrogenase [Parvibaculaceae bacterium]|jgi:short-subunit dehydrogenase|nr:SDR family NAD(P)-dependent oxidoreductase [Parvibaculaceae bacterium]
MTKTALITGAAGGLGRALALDLEKQGYALILTDRDEAALQSVATILAAPCEIIVADLRSPQDIARLSQRLEDAHNTVELLINNAGIGVPGSVTDIDPDLLQAHIDINLVAPMRLSQAAARSMSARKQGHIYSVVSLAGIFPLKDSAAYSASKFGLRGFNAALSLELAEHGVKVGGIYPSAIDTPMLQAEMAAPKGSPLNFSGSAHALSPEETSAAILKSLRKGALETHLPRSEGLLAGLVMSFPRYLGPVFRYMEKEGRKKQKAYFAKNNIIS